MKNIPMFVISILLLILSLYLTGCSAKNGNSTLFLKEDGSRLYNLEGKDCIENGYETVKGSDGTTYRLITVYSNCDVHKEREMKEFEPKQWLPVKPKVSK